MFGPQRQRLRRCSAAEDCESASRFQLAQHATYAGNGLGSPTPWFRLLLALWDGAMAIFGVKTSRQIRNEASRNSVDRIDFFPVLSRSERKLVVGEDGSHLDFRAAAPPR